MGCVGMRVERADDLSDALRRALAAGRPAVLDVITTTRATFRDVTSPLAAQPVRA
jgi:acetolactate synthase I/II/III large subunit